MNRFNLAAALVVCAATLATATAAAAGVHHGKTSAGVLSGCCEPRVCP
jgi:hypothetical protein